MNKGRSRGVFSRVDLCNDGQYRGANVVGQMALYLEWRIARPSSDLYLVESRGRHGSLLPPFQRWMRQKHIQDRTE